MDWRNTLEVQDFLPDYNREELGPAMRVADAHVISWVGSDHRDHTAMRQMGSMLPQHRALLSYSATRVKNGRGGKVFCHSERGSGKRPGDLGDPASA